MDKKEKFGICIGLVVGMCYCLWQNSGMNEWNFVVCVCDKDMKEMLENLNIEWGLKWCLGVVIDLEWLGVWGKWEEWWEKKMERKLELWWDMNNMEEGLNKPLEVVKFKEWKHQC
jgi:hypothetical protein